jgi:hypothetical protein
MLRRSLGTTNKKQQAIWIMYIMIRTLICAPGNVIGGVWIAHIVPKRDQETINE